MSVTPEGDYDAVYMVIKRVINGRTVRYVERLESRFFADIRDANFCDCGLYYDGRGNGSITMTLSGGTTWIAGQNLTCTASSSTFTSGSIGKSVIIQTEDDLWGIVVKPLADPLRITSEPPRSPHVVV